MATNRIAELRQERRLSQEQLADLVGAHWITISKLERGRMRLTQHWMERLGAALQVSPQQLLEPPDIIGTLKQVGQVNEDSTVTINPLDRPGNFFRSLFSGFLSSPEMGWIEVNTDAFKPVFGRGSLLQIAWQSDEDFDSLVGRLVYVDTKRLQGGAATGRLGILQVGSKPGLWDVVWPTLPPLTDCEPSRMAAVTAALFDQTYFGTPGTEHS